MTVSNNEKLLLSLLKAFLPLPDKKTIHSFEFIKDKDHKLGRKPTDHRNSPYFPTNPVINKSPKKHNTRSKHRATPCKKQLDRQRSVDERQSLILTDPSLYSPFVKDKQVVLDLNVQLNTGEKVDVEMQAINKQAFVVGGIKPVSCGWLTETSLNNHKDRLLKTPS